MIIFTQQDYIKLFYCFVAPVLSETGDPTISLKTGDKRLASSAFGDTSQPNSQQQR